MEITLDLKEELFKKLQEVATDEKRDFDEEIAYIIRKYLEEKDK